MSDETARKTALKLWVVLSRSCEAVRRRLEDSLRGSGLSEGEFGVLEALLHKGPLLLGEIQRKILVSSGGVTYLVDRLVQRGLVRREPCPTDRRAMYAVLTPKGDALIRQIFPVHAAVIEEAVSGLNLEQQAQATELLRTLGHAAAGEWTRSEGLPGRSKAR
jgi:MarR family 2-MHQ and catechol resistance regulon transcriptional repressor